MPRVWRKTGEITPDGFEVEMIVVLCGPCLDDGREVDGQERLSLGLFAGYYCDACWDASGYRKDGPEAFDATYAGETY